MELTELAQNYFGNTRSGSLAGPVGGFLIAVLVVFTALLIRNMNARLRRLPERFPDRTAAQRQPDGAHEPGVTGDNAQSGQPGKGVDVGS